MSLIHDALREMDRPTATPSTPAPAPQARRSPVATAVFAFAAVVLVGGGLLAWWSQTRTTPPAAPALASLPPPAPAPTAPPPPPVAELSTAPAEAPAAPKVEVVTAASPVAATAPSADKPAAAPARPVRASRPAKAKPEGLPAPAPTAAEPSSEQRFALFMQAMGGNDLPAAETQLKALRGQLGRGSVSLLRAEAWYALAGSDIAAARQAYTDILERLPGDEEASINLAAIELRQQRTEAARQILREALRHHPDSEDLRAAIARFRDARR